MAFIRSLWFIFASCLLIIFLFSLALYDPNNQEVEQARISLHSFIGKKDNSTKSGLNNTNGNNNDDEYEVPVEPNKNTYDEDNENNENNGSNENNENNNNENNSTGDLHDHNETNENGNVNNEENNNNDWDENDDRNNDYDDYDDNNGINYNTNYDPMNYDPNKNNANNEDVNENNENNENSIIDTDTTNNNNNTNNEAIINNATIDNENINNTVSFNATIPFLNITDDSPILNNDNADNEDNYSNFENDNDNNIISILEKMNVEMFGSGVLSIYPLQGSEKGGYDITFMFTFKDQKTKAPKEFFKECIVDGENIPISKISVYDVGPIYFVSCSLSPHSPAEVAVSLVTENATRYVPYNVQFTFLPENATVEKIPVALCTVFQNQARYLREWIAFHTIFGVSKFYLYDQGSTDNWKSTVQDYIDMGLVVPVEWNFNWMFSIRHQASGFWHCLRSYGENTNWMGFTDVDEFLYMPKNYNQNLNNNNNNNNLISFLDDYKEFGGLMVDRLNFGPSGHIKRPSGLVIENYTRRINSKFVGLEVKSIVQPKYVTWCGCGGVHTFSMVKGRPNVDATKNTRVNGCGVSGKLSWDKIRIAHYWTKSVEDWGERLKRDSNPYKVQAEDILKWLYFTFDDYDTLQYVNETKARMEKMPTF